MAKKDTPVKAVTPATTGIGITFPTILIVIGGMMLMLWGTHRFLYNRSLELSQSLISTYAQKPASAAVPLRITVGERINVPIVEAGRVNGVWGISDTSANHVHQSAQPGQQGNIVIYGHNLNTIFGYLVDAKVGTLVKIYTTDGKAYQYKISDIHVVSPSQTDLLKPTEVETLTLYTCTGLLDSLRFVARAVPWSDTP